jgi:hypothetical protein
MNKGFPVTKARFRAAVDNADGTPEMGFDIKSNNASRHVTMYLTTIGLICEHRGKIFATSLDNLIQVDFKSE